MASIFQPDLFKGKSVFITGGTSGINLRIAERFSEQGANVAILGRNPEKAEKAAEGVRGFGGKCLPLTADVRDYPALETAMATAREAHGPFDVVLAGAAGNFPQPAAALSANGFKAVVDIDLLGAFNAFKAAFNHLRKPGASLLALSAVQSFSPMAFQAHVCAAKAGIDMLVKTLALEWGGLGVRANCINPGPVDDTEGMDRLTPTEDAKKKLEAAIALGRYATKDEIADLALFLCSPAAAYITGATMVIDGGQSLAGSGLFMKAMLG